MLRALAEADKCRSADSAYQLRLKKDEQFAPAIAELEREYARFKLRSEAILSTFRCTAEQCLPALTAVLADRDSPLRIQAADALAALGPRAATAVPQLASALSDGDLELAERAYYALRAIGPAAVEATPQLLQLMDSNRAYLGSQMPWLLGRFGGEAGPDAVLALLKHAADIQALDAIKAIAPAVYDAYATQLQAAIHPPYDPQGKDTAQQAWAKELSSHTLRWRVARLWRQNPGAPGWPSVDADSSQAEKAAYLDYWVAHPFWICPEMDYVLPGLSDIPEAALPVLWQTYTEQNLLGGWDTQPDASLHTIPALARALATHDPQAYGKFRQMVNDSDANQRRLGLYGLASCGTAAAELAPEMMLRLRSAELTPYERALCARVLAVSGAAAPYAAELLALLETAYSDAYVIRASELEQYGFDAYAWSLEEGEKYLGLTYGKLTSALTEALGACGPEAAPMLLAKAKEKLDYSATDKYAGEPEKQSAAALTRRSALTALGLIGPVPEKPRAEIYPGLPPPLPAAVDVALQWLQRNGGLSSFKYDPAKMREELRDRVAAATALGGLGCADERVIRALLDAAKDDTADPYHADVDPNDYRARLLPPALPLREAAAKSLERLAGHLQKGPRT